MRDRITDSDFVAVSMLSVSVPAKAAVGLRNPAVADKITKLLAAIPTDTKISELTLEKAKTTLGETATRTSSGTFSPPPTHPAGASAPQPPAKSCIANALT
ncbi:hypothetical protein J7I89_23105 [Arthrobacter sp. ISL-5]|nr:hypothetical protein [Arthrobacter sp. ISL-5]